MEDLGEALSTNPDMLFLGGGNPAHVPALEQWAQEALSRLAQNPATLRRLIGIYQSPQGHAETITNISRYLQRHCGWPVTERNIALVNGSQTAFFILLNLFGGVTSAGEPRSITLPLAPEYLGYAGQSVSDPADTPAFQAVKPLIQHISDHRFKYHIDFNALQALPRAGAYCVSRPTNPTGNLLTDEEMAQLGALAAAQQVPLIVDCAYGQPFPGLVYQAAQPYWDANSVVVLSLSKLGFPGVRTGIVVASDEVIQAVVRANTVLSLASGNLGPMLLDEMLRDGALTRLCTDALRPFYLKQRDFMLQQLDSQLAGLPYAIHQPEGAMFIWLWLQDLPIPSAELYQRLKARDVLVMAGEEFFFGLREPWSHKTQCVRLTYCRPEADMKRAVAILAEEVRAAYG